MRTYKITVSVKKGQTDTLLTAFELDTRRWTEGFLVKDLGTFKDDASVIFTMEELPEPEIEPGD